MPSSKDDRQRRAAEKEARGFLRTYGIEGTATKMDDDRTVHHTFKVYRVFACPEDSDNGWIVIEHVGSAQFRVGSSIYGGAPNETMKAELDRSDAWSVLHSLQNIACFPEVAARQPAFACIDSTVAQANSTMQGYIHALEEEEPQPTGGLTLDNLNTIGKTSGLLTPLPAWGGEEGPSGDEVERMEQEVWAFGRGERLVWCPAGRTPAGRRCDILTFSGSEEVLVTSGGIQLPVAG